MYPRVVAVRHVSDYKLKITFSDGVISVIDWQQRLKKARPGGVFEPLRSLDYFKQVELWEGTIRWPNGADVCPDVLYEEVSQKNKFHGEVQEALTL